MFERSRSGQQNRSTFFGVDFVCYVEGSDGGTSGPDVTFWQAVLGSFRPDLKVRCVPRGGKPILERLAQNIIRQDINGVLVAMDSDYDDFFGDKIEDRRVLYTYGYSWENDLFSRENITLAYCAITHCGHAPRPVADAIRSNFDRLARELAWPVRADFYALCAGSSVFPRKSPGRVVMSSGVDRPPVVRRVDVFGLIGAVNVMTRPRVLKAHTGYPMDIIRYCVGHVIGLASSMLLRMLVRQHRRRSAAPPDHCRDVALQTLGSFFSRNRRNPISRFHSAQCLRV